MGSPVTDPANPVNRRSGRIKKKVSWGNAKKAVAKNGSRKRAVKANKPVPGAETRSRHQLKDKTNSLPPVRPSAGLKDDSEGLEYPGFALGSPAHKECGT